MAAERRIAGKCARAACVVPDAVPFAAALWGALAGAEAASRVAPPGRVACSRFAAAARWMQALVHPEGLDILPLRRIVRAQAGGPERLADAVIKFDASPWGGGAALFVGGAPSEYFAATWSPEVCALFRAEIGVPKYQTFWEYLTVFLALCVWGDAYRAEAVTVAGDNVPALEGALNLKGKSLLNHVTRELAWRRARRRWSYVVAHLPAEHNITADALSRLAAPVPAAFAGELALAKQVAAPAIAELFVTMRAPPGRQRAP